MVINKKPGSRVLMITPTLGQRSELLRKSLESIRNQSVKSDIVMIFPLKNKEIREIAKKYGTFIIDDPGGLSAALNAGLEIAGNDYEYIGWLGDDDLLAKDSLQTAISAMESNPDASIAFGHCDYIDNNGKIIFTSRAGNLAPWMMTWGPNLVPLPGILFRKSALNAAGKFDENNKYSMDLDMLLRLRKVGRFINTKKTLASFRWHVSSTTVKNRDKVLKEAQAVQRRYLPKYLRPFSPLWEMPVRIATKIAANRLSYLAGFQNK